MPAIDNLRSPANEIGGQLAAIRRELKDLSNNSIVGVMTSNYIGIYNTGFAIPAAGVFQNAATITVPPGYYAGQLTFYASASGMNSTGADDGIGLQVYDNGAQAWGTGFFVHAASGARAVTNGVWIMNHTGLTPGQQITIQARLFTGNGWAANSYNGYAMTIAALWTQQ